MEQESFTVVTWNVQGGHGLDVAAVAEVVTAAAPDVVVVQEVQRRQARRLAVALEMTAMRWAMKHFPVRTWPEGLAVFTPHRLVAADTFVVRRRPLWDWRRRIGVDAEISRDRDRYRVINLHLSPHDAGAQRRREAQLVLRRAGTGRPPIIAGDLNDTPGGPGYATLIGAGWQDAWLAVASDDEGFTNWTPGDRAARPPTQRIDYVLVPSGWVVEEAAVLADAGRLDRLATLSDHLPLSAALRPPEASATTGAER